MPRPLAILAHWHHSVEDVQASALDFYTSIEKALKSKEISDLSTERIEWNEGGLLTAKRTYLRVSYRRFVFDICALSFGKDFMWSWWLGKRVPNLAALGCGIIVGVPVALVVFVAAGGLTGFLAFCFVLAIAGIAFLGSDDVREALGELPWIGPLYTKLFNPATYYSEDTRMVFEDTVHRVVVDVVSGVLAINKLTPLTPREQTIERRSP